MAQDFQAIPGARFMDPAVLARIGNLELVARAVVDGFINGLHKAPYFGASVDFAEHRGYVPGDDIRRMDWRLWARTDRYYIKEYEAESNMNFSVLLDCSKSMDYGSRGITKFDYARILTACLTNLVHHQRDRVGFVAFDTDVVEHVPPSAKHMETVLHVLDRLKPGRPGSLKGPLHKLAEHFGRRGVLVIISDFYEDPESVVFAFGAILVNLLVTSAAPELIEPATVATPDAGNRFQLTVDVADVDAMCERLTARGVTFLNGPIDRPWGVRTACFRDPAGLIVIQQASVPALALHNRGHKSLL